MVCNVTFSLGVIFGVEKRSRLTFTVPYVSKNSTSLTETSGHALADIK